MPAEPRILAGRYRVDDLIGQGGMAKVFRGYDLTLGREVAIKILDTSLAADAAFRTRFRLEAQAASRMSHSTVVRVFDAGEDKDPSTGAPVPYIVMELVDGVLLKSVMSEGPVPPADAVKYVDGILEALDYSHRAGVVHRDIKPGNVMITRDGGVKVMDFGIARAVSDSSSTVAETTRILGTAAYLSPEQAKGASVDARTDLYSAGVVLYELLSGRQPFRGDSPVAVAYQHVSETPLPPTEINEDAPASLNPVVMRALAKDPGQRFTDAADFRASLAAAASGRAPSKRQMNSLTHELYGPAPRRAEETVRSLQQLSTDSTMTRTQSGPPVVWIWAGVALLAVLLVAVVFWALSLETQPVASGSRTVPDLRGQSFASAEAALEELDLIAVQVFEASADIDENLVTRTDPAADRTVERGQVVNVYVSTGIELVTVPKLEGLTEEEARVALEAAELRLGPILPRSHKDTPAGIVLEVNDSTGAVLTEGAEVPPRTVVTLYIASGTVELRNVVGFRLDAAEEELRGLGLIPLSEPDETCPATDPPQVSDMSERPGEVPIHSDIVLFHCTGE